MKSEEDFDVDAAIARTLWSNHKLIPPNSRVSKWWFSLIIALVLVRRALVHPSPRMYTRMRFSAFPQYNAVYIPIELCFGEQIGAKHTSHIILDFFVDYLFMCRRPPHTALLDTPSL